MCENLTETNLLIMGAFTTIGYGGNRPIVPHSDLDNRWKNRRVEFILIKK